MKAVFATPLRAQASTIVGRIVPLATELARDHEIHVLVLGPIPHTTDTLRWHSVGSEPFTRTATGKTRYKGLRLIANMFLTALRTARTLRRLNPDAVVIVKPLPSNTLGVYLWHITSRLFYKQKALPARQAGNSYKLILDADDFELAANQLSSLAQRAAVHWSERLAARLSHTIVAATPFLEDHFRQLTANQKPTILIPTGLTIPTFSYQKRPKQTPHLVYLGSVSRSSGHRVDMLPDLLAILRTLHPAITLTIAGDGDDMQSLQEAFERHNATAAVTWHGRFSLIEIPDLLCAHTIIIDPIDASIANRAKSSFRVALAAAVGLPVVTSNVGIRPHLIPPSLHSRLFAEPGNATDYARQIQRLIDQPLSAIDRDQLRQHAQQFSWAALAHKYVTIVER